MKIILGADHRGVDLAEFLINKLKEEAYEVEYVPLKNHEADDYTDFAFMVGEKVRNTDNLGILICGNGIGMSIAANKVDAVRCARVLTIDDAFKCKNHNGANLISLSSEVDFELNFKIVCKFISTSMPFEERCIRRINKITEYEKRSKNEC